ncbi:MAG: chromate resistance protein ChrB [Acidocella sp.]|nr:chromate resistance protein ChrB [Acidocella sp.]
MDSWFLITYKVPSEPSKGRVAVWRRLKSLGAVYLQNSVCLLPKTDDHLRQLKILDNEITEMNGEAVLLETVALDRTEQSKVIARFKADRDEEYRAFLERCASFEAEIAKEIELQRLTYAELEEVDADMKKLKGWLEKIRKLDFYGAALAEESANRLHSCEVLLDSFAQLVFEAHNENQDRLS